MQEDSSLDPLIRIPAYLCVQDLMREGESQSWHLDSSQGLKIQVCLMKKEGNAQERGHNINQEEKEKQKIINNCTAQNLSKGGQNPGALML